MDIKTKVMVKQNAKVELIYPHMDEINFYWVFIH
jgi:hypothetical protein